MGKLGIVSKPHQEITVEDLKRKFPQKKNTITEDTVSMINSATSDPMFDPGEFMSTLIDYQGVMNNGNSMKEYINAVKFCAYLEAEEYNITEAYKRARANDEFVIERRDAKPGSAGHRELTTQASRFHKTPMVRQILTQSDMPLYLMFQASRYEAVKVLHGEMYDAPLSKDRIAAADKLLTHVKPPENMQVELAVGPNQEAKDLGAQLSEQLAQSVAMQRKLLEAGVDLKSATRTGIKLNDSVIDAEVVDNG